MYAGREVESGLLRDMLRSPLHPYTAGLLASTVHGQPPGRDLETIPGAPRDPIDGARQRGHAFWPELDIRGGDAIVPKYRYSAFIAGASDLETWLWSQGLDTMLIAVTLTNTCCDSSACDAMMLNFRTVMVADANAAMTDAEHNAWLTNFCLSFGDILDTAEIEADLVSLAPFRTPRADRITHER